MFPGCLWCDHSLDSSYGSLGWLGERNVGGHSKVLTACYGTGLARNMAHVCGLSV